ncbi:LysM peptidoglycan-binding domain-containing protein [bacterium]|nr:LysM peptidoglycan-binding domain-containing protein [bacterium]
MKSSTLIRSMLSRENMDIIENIGENSPTEETKSPEEYYRSGEETSSSKSQEIDLLWQSFKTAQFNSGSPAWYVTLGFICGVVVTLSCVGIFGYFASKPDVNISIPSFNNESVTSSSQDDNQEEARVIVPDENDNVAPVQQQSETQQPVNVSNAKQHTVASGETIEGIIRHYYGTYSPELAQKVQQANNLTSLDHINIDQVLIIPEN